MRKQYRGYLFTFFSLAALLIGMLGIRFVLAQGHTQGASAQKAAPLTCGTWSIVASPNGFYDSNLAGVAAVSASNIWAVGSSTSDSQTLIEHWNGTSWSIVASPNVGSYINYLTGVAAVSASNIWAVGSYLNSDTSERTLIEHWNGTSWSIVKSPNVNLSYNRLTGVAAVSASNIWAVGYAYSSTSERTLIEHWNGTSWSVVKSPNVGSFGSDLFGVVRVPGSSNIWAVGRYALGTGYYQTLIEHWSGTSWSVVKSPNVGFDSNLAGVAVVSASNIWAVGSSNNGSQTLIEHWNGTSWSVVASPNVSSHIISLTGVAAAAASNIWAVGYYLNSSSIYQTLIEHWNGTSWSVVASPNVGSSDSNLFGVVRVPGSSNIWAVGSSHTYNTPEQTLIEFYC